MTILLQNLPPDVEAELRRRATATGQSIEQVVVELIQIGLSSGELDENLQAVIGTWVDDPEFEAAIAEFERVDPEAWR